MGKLLNRKVIQSRTWLDGKQNILPPYDYDYTYPISVYEAIHQDFDDDSPTLKDELESIYRLLNQKQPLIDGGIPGNVMTWSGVVSQIGSMEVVKKIDPEPANRSLQKLVSERAIGDALDEKIDISTYNTHVDDKSIHISDNERHKWNSMAPMSSLQSHIANVSIHINDEERIRWNNKAEQKELDDHIFNLNNPHNVTAHQVNTYTQREIDEMFTNIRESFFNYVNILWDARVASASLVEYAPTNWNPNYILGYNDTLPDVPDPTIMYFALKPATNYKVEESADCIIYCKRPGLSWQEVGFQTMSIGDMVIRYPDTAMYVWVQGRFLQLFTDSNISGGVAIDPDGSIVLGESNLMWRPVVDEDGNLSWIKSQSTTPPDIVNIKGEDGYTPIKGIDYDDGRNGEGVPIGGQPGEVLTKLTEDNYDTVWKPFSEVLSDMLLRGDKFPDGFITWDIIVGRPKIYNTLGTNEDGVVTQKAISDRFDYVDTKIQSVIDRIEGTAGIDKVHQSLKDHIDDYNNPHRVTPKQIGAATVTELGNHVSSFDNPHNVTAEQVGLGNVDNTSDLDKPISIATQDALNEIINKLNSISGGGVTIDPGGTGTGSTIVITDCIEDVVWNESISTFIFTYASGDEKRIEVDFNQNIFQKIEFDDENREIVFTLVDGTETRINISGLIFKGSTSENIFVDVDKDNTVKATIIPGTIGKYEIVPSVELRGSPITTTQPRNDKSTRIATTEYVRDLTIDSLESYEVERPLSANMGRILNQEKASIDQVYSILNEVEGIKVIDSLDSTSIASALSANKGRELNLTKAPRVHTSTEGSTFGRAALGLWGHVKPAEVEPVMDGTTYIGDDDGTYARANHRHHTDVTRAPVSFPDRDNNIYSLTGEPRATMPPDESNDDRIATTEWVRRNGAGVAFGYCLTESENPVKSVSLRSSFMEPPVFFLRQIGSTVVVTFRYADTSGHELSEITMLDVEDSGPAPILYGGNYLKNNVIGGNFTHMFTFDGTYWRLINPVDLNSINELGPGEFEWPDLTDLTFNITFDGNGGTVSYSIDTTNRYGKLTKFPTPGYEGHNFLGWYTDPIGGYPVNTNYIFRADSTVYAHWSIIYENTVDIKFDPMLGTVNTSEIKAGVDKPVGELPLAQRDGYIFLGWYTEPIIGGHQITPDDMFSSDTILYARWMQDVTYKAINVVSGYQGFTTAGDGNPDEEGNVNHVFINITFPPKQNDVRLDVSMGDEDFACLMGDGSQIYANSPKVLSITKESALVQFKLEDTYPNLSPVQLVYRNEAAYIRVVELDVNGRPLNANQVTYPLAPILTTIELPNGTIDSQYSATLKASGEQPVYWFINEGNLPKGLTLNNKTGEITGTPLETGKFPLVLQGINNSGTLNTSMSLTIKYPEILE